MCKAVARLHIRKHITQQGWIQSQDSFMMTNLHKLTSKYIIPTPTPMFGGMLLMGPKGGTHCPCLSPIIKMAGSLYWHNGYCQTAWACRVGETAGKIANIKGWQLIVCAYNIQTQMVANTSCTCPAGRGWSHQSWGVVVCQCSLVERQFVWQERWHVQASDVMNSFLFSMDWHKRTGTR